MIGVVLRRQPKLWRISLALAFSIVVSFGLILAEALKSHSTYYWFLLFNVFLAFVPVLAAIWLVKRLPKHAWLSLENMLLTIVWLAFLPNSFYMITDLIHSQTVIGFDLLYSIVMIFSCVFISLVAGYVSLYLVHWELLKRFYYRWAHLIIAIILLSCSFAIYLGRYLRWSSWDVVLNPAGLIFDLTDTVINPSTHPDLVVTTLTFFILLGSMYLVIWQFIKALRPAKK